MAENKKSVLLYCDIIHTVKELSNDEAGKLFKHYLEYINDLNPMPPDKLTQIVFEPIKQNLKRDLKKWESKSERNSEIAKDGWVKRKQANECERIKYDAKDADKDTVTVKETVKDLYKDKLAFSEFWNLYPVKVGRVKCEPKWNKLNLEQQQLILTTLPNFIKNKPFEKYTHPNPETYLNQERWDDEITIDLNIDKKHYYLSSPFGRWDGFLTTDELKAKTLTGHWTLIN